MRVSFCCSLAQKYEHCEIVQIATRKYLTRTSKGIRVDSFVCLTVCSLSICMSIGLCVCPFVCYSIFVSIGLCVCQSVCYSIFVYIGLRVCPFVCLSIYVSVHLSKLRKFGFIWSHSLCQLIICVFVNLCVCPSVNLWMPMYLSICPLSVCVPVLL